MNEIAIENKLESFSSESILDNATQGFIALATLDIVRGKFKNKPISLESYRIINSEFENNSLATVKILFEWYWSEIKYFRKSGVHDFLFKKYHADINEWQRLNKKWNK